MKKKIDIYAEALSSVQIRCNGNNIDIAQPLGAN